MLWFNSQKDYCEHIAKYLTVLAWIMLITCNLGFILMFLAAYGIQRRSDRWRVVLLIGTSFHFILGLVGLAWLIGKEAIEYNGPPFVHDDAFYFLLVFFLIITAIAATPLLWLLQPGTCYACRQRTVGRGILICSGCGYNLRQIGSKECPECGLPVDVSRDVRRDVFRMN